MNRSLTPFVMGALVLSCSPSFAQETKPAPIGVQVETGTLIDLRGSRSSSSYNRIIYNGKTLSSNGTTFKPADATHVFSLDGASRSDFSPDLKLDLLQGNGATTNSTLNGYGIKKLKLRGPLSTIGYQAIARAAARLDGNQALLSAGFESAAFHPVVIEGMTNWLHFGAAGERFWQTRSLGKDEARSVLNYRAFFGKASWKANSDRATVTPEVVLQAAPDLAKLKTFLDSTDTKPVSKFLAFWAAFYDSAKPEEKVEVEADYVSWITRNLAMEKKQFELAPTTAVGLESEGWWSVAGDMTKRRASAIAALGYTHWFGTGNGGPFSSSFRIRYELGYDRAAPQTKLNRLLMSVNLNF